MLKLFAYLKIYIWSILAVIIFLFFQTMADLYLPNLMSNIVNNGMLRGDTAYIWRVGGFMLVIAAGSAVCAVIGSFLASKVGIGFGRDIREKVFTRVESYSLNEFDKLGTASLVTRTTNDITQVQMVVVMMLRMMIIAPITGIGGLIMALSKDRKLAIILAISIPVLIILIILVARIIVPLFKAIQKKLDKLNLVARENLTGIRVIRAFNRIEDEKEKFNEANVDLTTTSIKANKIMAILMPAMMVIMNLTSVAIVWYGAIYVNQGTLLIGDMMAFLQYAMQIMLAFVMLSMMFVMIPRAQASAVRINEVLDMKSEINNPKEVIEDNSKRGYVNFKDVTFSYPGAEEPALKNISFSTTPGEVMAIIGGTGSGKSTLISLIPRFYDVDSGVIEVDGVDIREMNQETLREKIGFVPQKSVLFSGSISENIRYGKEDATEEEIFHAAKIAQATEFINSMNEGYNSEISQGGGNVSGGQKQRLSIARALVRKPEIYIFDDSFSALDFKTDAKLRAALKKETINSTVIIVAQRISTVMDANHILVLDEGEIVGMGTHKELLNNCDIYKEIASSQLSEEELA